MTITIGPIRLDNIEVTSVNVVPSKAAINNQRLILEVHAVNSDDVEFRGYCTFTTQELIGIAEKLLK